MPAMTSRWMADDISVDGVPVELAMEYTPGDRLVRAASRWRDAQRPDRIQARTGLKMTTRGHIHQAELLPARGWRR